MVLKRGGRKAWKGRKQARRGRKVKGMRAKFADKHSFKLMGGATYLYSTASGPMASGSTFITQGSLVPVNNRYAFGGSFAFNAAQTLQWSQLNSLFDRYTVNGIKVKVIPEVNFSSAGGNGVLPVMRIVHDYDDNQTPTVGDIWSRRGVERRLDKPFSVYFKPKMLIGVWQSQGGAIGQATGPARTLNCAFGTTPLYGLKYAVRDWYNNGVPNDMIVRFEITYYITFREQIQVNKVGLEAPDANHPDEAGVEGNTACENIIVEAKV